MDTREFKSIILFSYAIKRKGWTNLEICAILLIEILVSENPFLPKIRELKNIQRGVVFV